MYFLAGIFMFVMVSIIAAFEGDYSGLVTIGKVVGGAIVLFVIMWLLTEPVVLLVVVVFVVIVLLLYKATKK